MIGSIAHTAKSDTSTYTLDGTDPNDCIKSHDGAQNSGAWKSLAIVGDYHDPISIRHFKMAIWDVPLSKIK